MNQTTIIFVTIGTLSRQYQLGHLESAFLLDGLEDPGGFPLIGCHQADVSPWTVTTIKIDLSLSCQTKLAPPM